MDRLTLDVHGVETMLASIRRAAELGNARLRDQRRHLLYTIFIYHVSVHGPPGLQVLARKTLKAEEIGLAK